jgi:hexosaminidase
MSYKIIPQPQFERINEGSLDLTEGVTIFGLTSKILNDLLVARLESLNIKIKDDATVSINFKQLKPDTKLTNTKVLLSNSTYIIAINANSIEVSASHESGFVYGVASLLQLLRKDKVKQGLIEDFPNLNHRGFMLDVARHFIPLDVIKELLVILAMHKINFFHWHLTDDQGWRIEIKKYPNLTANSNIKKANDTDFPTSGFYTQQEVTALIDFASSLNIEIIPEIDVPGHTTAAVSAYPTLGCKQTLIPLASGPGIYQNIICLGREQTHQFVEDVLAEVCALFPSNKIHIGGDEVNPTNWLECEHCRNYAVKIGAKNGQQFQAHFTKKIVNYLVGKGMQTIVWNDAFSQELDSTNTICQFWQDGKKKPHLQTAIRNKNRIINSNFFGYYLDYPHSLNSVRKAYEYNPINDLEDVAKLKGLDHLHLPKQVIGVEAALWTELVTSKNIMNLRLYPRLIAISERAWNQNFNNYSNFVERVFDNKSFYEDFKIIIPDLNTWESKKVAGLISNIKHFNQMIKPSLVLKLIINNFKSKDFK